MSSYTDETFDSIWTFVDKDGEVYNVVREKRTQVYKVFLTRDVEEINHTNYVVKSNYKKLSGEFYDHVNMGHEGIVYNFFYVIAENNILHSETKAAAYVPAGLEIYKPKEDIYHYIIHGKIMSRHTWLTWVKDTSSWSTVMANFLGSKNAN